MHALSSQERADALIALSIVFDGQVSSDGAIKSGSSVSDVVKDSLRGLHSSKSERILERVSYVESLSGVHRQQWLGRWIDNLRRRGRSSKLEHQVNPEHIVRALKNEPHPVRRNILNYLPTDLRSRLVELPSTESSDLLNVDLSDDPPAEILDVIKHRFLANFAQAESISDFNAIDELTTDEFQHFVRALSLREIAVACRGIRSREKIAAFLCRFAEDDAKTIARHLSSLDEVEPIWVSVSDRTVRRLWNRRLRPHMVLHKIGLELIACAFAERSGTAIRYASQKMSYRVSQRWEKMVSTWGQRLQDSDVSFTDVERRRAQVVVAMAERFKEMGSL